MSGTEDLRQIRIDKKNLIILGSGIFPTLISSNKRENGRLMGNRTFCSPKQIVQTGLKTEISKNDLKKLKSMSTFSNKIIRCE